MALYRPSELRAFLRSIDKNPLRFSSQRFLVDGNIVEKIQHTVGGEKNILEIGPGPGVLTEAFLKDGCRVVAVEKDGSLAKALQRFSSERLHVIEEDVLNCSLAEISKFFSGERFAVVSNLPYHLTTPIIEWLLQGREHFSRAVLMVQKEAGRRLTAGRGGFLPLFLAYCGEVSYEFPVSRNSFWPRPSVDSAVILLKPIKSSFDSKEEEKFLSFLKDLFCAKRKTMVHLLSEILGREHAERALACAHIPREARPEELLLGEFVEIFIFLQVYKRSEKRGRRSE